MAAQAWNTASPDKNHVSFCAVLLIRFVSDTEDVETTARLGRVLLLQRLCDMVVARRDERKLEPAKVSL